jgi:cellulose synthase/poly-beta-1,6-N-acetylglucosamine synthase-like glycosyltransferase
MIIPTLLLILAVAVAVPIAVVAIEVCAAVWPSRLRAVQATTRPTVDVLIPAHNEETVIEATLDSVRAQVRPGDRIFVVADNCTDRTAELARRAGVIVCERRNDEQRGKGFALQFGVQQIAPEHADVVVIVDADCRLEPGTLDALASTAVAENRPVQGDYLMTCPPEPSPRDVVSHFAVTVKNRVRQRGVNHLGGAAVLTGSGMAFPWEIMKHARLDGGNIVEDMQLSFELLIAGHAPLYCSDARVVAPLPQQHKASRAQRTRWEHGHLQTMLNRVPRLLWESVRQRRLGLLGAAIDLAVPPLSLLVLAWGVVCLATIGGAIAGLGFVPLVVTAVSGLLLAASMWLSLACFGDGLTVGAVFAAVPRYVVGKVPIYASFLFRRQKAWVRTDRDQIVHPHIHPEVPA